MLSVKLFLHRCKPKLVNDFNVVHDDDFLRKSLDVNLNECSSVGRFWLFCRLRKWLSENVKGKIIFKLIAIQRVSTLKSISRLTNSDVISAMIPS